MKALLFFPCFFLIAMNLFSHHAPITALPDGEYLGVGAYHHSNQGDGHFITYNRISGNHWLMNVLGEESDTSRRYDAYYTFNGDGTFQVDLVARLEITLPDGTTSHENLTYHGSGYCMSVQCHLSIDMGENGFFEETLSFPEYNRIYKLSSVTYNDGEGNPVVITVEEALTMIDTSGV